jgi:hypothetical protein
MNGSLSETSFEGKTYLMIVQQKIHFRTIVPKLRPMNPLTVCKMIKDV